LLSERNPVAQGLPTPHSAATFAARVNKAMLNKKAPENRGFFV